MTGDEAVELERDRPRRCGWWQVARTATLNGRACPQPQSPAVPPVAGEHPAIRFPGRGRFASDASPEACRSGRRRRRSPAPGPVGGARRGTRRRESRPRAAGRRARRRGGRAPAGCSASAVRPAPADDSRRLRIRLEGPPHPDARRGRGRRAASDETDPAPSPHACGHSSPVVCVPLHCRGRERRFRAGAMIPFRTTTVRRPLL